MIYTIESWYPSQLEQNTIERVKKFAVKLITNDFKSPYSTLLEFPANMTTQGCIKKAI
jgi:hypothetical protein